MNAPLTGQSLFALAFGQGDMAVVVSEAGPVYYGEVFTLEDGLVLRRKCQKPLFLEWDGVRMVAHDGFPVRELRGWGSYSWKDAGTPKPLEYRYQRMLEASRVPVPVVAEYGASPHPWLRPMMAVEAVTET